jgi:hypothetical protein
MRSCPSVQYAAQVYKDRMSFQANVLKVMIASPGDVAKERTIATEEIHRWNDANASTRRLVLLPVKWETHSTPEQGDQPQPIINRQLLKDADIVIGIFGTRIGTVTEDYVSGSVEEIKKHVAAGKTAKIYFSDVPVPPSSINPAQYASLQQFRLECQRTGLYATFNSAEQFRMDFSHHLALELNLARWVWLGVEGPPTEQNATGVTADGLRLLKAIAKDDQEVVVTKHSGGRDEIYAGYIQLTDHSTGSAKRWHKVINELVTTNILEEAGEGHYRTTAVGREVTEQAIADEEATKPIEIRLTLSDPSEIQRLAIESNVNVLLHRLDFLTSTEACIATQHVFSSRSGMELKPKIDNEKIMTLFNSARPDRNNLDLSGPAKLRLVFTVDYEYREVVLPVMLQPKMVNNTPRITLIGSGMFKLPR